MFRPKQTLSHYRVKLLHTLLFSAFDAQIWSCWNFWFKRFASFTLLSCNKTYNFCLFFCNQQNSQISLLKVCAFKISHDCNQLFFGWCTFALKSKYKEKLEHALIFFLKKALVFLRTDTRELSCSPKGNNGAKKI